MANAVDEEAKRTEGKKALAVESFARALRQVRTRTCFDKDLASILTHSSTMMTPRFRPFSPTMRVTTLLTWLPSCEQRIMRENQILV